MDGEAGRELSDAGFWGKYFVKVEICTKFPVENYVDFGEKCIGGPGIEN